MDELFNSHPANAAEAKAVMDALPDGSAQSGSHSPSTDHSQLPMPQLPMPTPVQEQEQGPGPSPPGTEQQALQPGVAESSAAATASDSTKTDPTNADGTEASASNGTPSSGIPIPTLQNLVASIHVDCRLDLKTIALHSRNAEYNPKRFSACVMRLRDPKSTALIFASGKLVVTGVKSEADARLGARKFARILQKLGFNAKFCNFKIHNVVASVDARFPVHIARMQAVHHAFSSYEPGTYHGYPESTTGYIC